MVKKGNNRMAVEGMNLTGPAAFVTATVFMFSPGVVLLVLCILITRNSSVHI